MSISQLDWIIYPLVVIMDSLWFPFYVGGSILNFFFEFIVSFFFLPC